MNDFVTSPEIRSALERYQLRSKEVQGHAIGKLNTIDVFVNPSGQLFCLRKEKDNNRGWIRDYLQELHDAMGGKQYGLEITYRDVAKQAAHMRRLKDMGINVPEVYAHGSDWMLMSYSDGVPLSAVLPIATPQDTHTAITVIMNAWIDAHSKGECLWDRCGKNELFSKPQTASFIDFDVDVTFSTSVPVGVQASYDLAMGIRAYLLQAQHKDVATNAIINVLFNSPAQALYQPRHLSEVFELQTEYYKKLAVMPEQSDFYAPQRCVEPYIDKLLNWLRRHHGIVHGFRKHDPH